MPIEATGLSHPGLRRSLNEDSFHVDPETGLMLVADGVGGHDAGEVASKIAIEEISKAGPAGDPDGIEDHIRSLVASANASILELNRARGYPEDRGMGTTLAGLWAQEDRSLATVFHVGDSRIYRFRDKTLTPISRDHSLFQDWLDAGEKGPAPRKNIITRALGASPEVAADVSTEACVEGDLFLLCSDGLTDMVEDRDIAEILSLQPDLQEGCRNLIKEANANGGKDNVTVILCRI